MPTKVKDTRKPTGDYGRVNDDGEVAEVGAAPDAVVMPDGSTVVTPVDAPTDPALLTEAGYLPVVSAERETPPGQEIAGYEYKVEANVIEEVPVFQDIPTPEPLPVHPDMQHVIDKLGELEAKVNEIGMFDETVQALSERMDQMSAWLDGVEAPSMLALLDQVQADIAKLKRGPAAPAKRAPVAAPTDG